MKFTSLLHLFGSKLCTVHHPTPVVFKLYLINKSIFQCSDALQSSTLPEAAELLDLLNHIEVEGLLFAHDKLAVRQVSICLPIFIYKSSCNFGDM